MNSTIATLILFVILILLILPIVILSMRNRRFIRIACAYKNRETERMARLSSIALRIYVFLFALSYLPGLLFGHNSSTDLSWLLNMDYGTDRGHRLGPCSRESQSAVRSNEGEDQSFTERGCRNSEGGRRASEEIRQSREA
jgi:hypothetical protein